jgi:hypothetical protein
MILGWIPANDGSARMMDRRQILLGGTHDPGVWDLDPNLAKKQEILSKHKNFFENLRAC